MRNGFLYQLYQVFQFLIFVEKFVSDFCDLQSAAQSFQIFPYVSKVFIGRNFCDENVFRADVKFRCADIQRFQMARKFACDFSCTFCHRFYFPHFFVIQKHEFVIFG